MIKLAVFIGIVMSLCSNIVYAGVDKDAPVGNQGYILGGPLAQAQQRTEAIEQALDNQIYTQQGVVYVQPIKVSVNKPVEEAKRSTISGKDVSNRIRKIDDWVLQNLW